MSSAATAEPTSQPPIEHSGGQGSASASAAQTTSSSTAAGRVARSRRNRPCDSCRRFKHLCIIPIKDEPCVGCKSRDKACTFDTPPPERRGGTGRGRARLSSGTAGRASARASSTGARGGRESMSPSTTSSAAEAPGGSLLSSGTTTIGAGAGARYGDAHSPHGLAQTLAPGALSLGFAPTTSTMQETQQQPNDDVWGGLASGVFDVRVPTVGPSAIAMPPPAANPSVIPSWSPRPLYSLAQTSGIDHNHRGDQHPPWTRAGPSQPHPRHSASRHADPPSARSLDPDPESREESHFVGVGAMTGLALDEMESSELSSDTLSFRQVSRDARHPAFFVRYPSLMYDQPDDLTRAAKLVYEAICRDCEGLVLDVSGQSLNIMRTVVLPAVPFIDGDRLASECRGLDERVPIPYVLVGVIIAYCSIYMAPLRPIAKPLWRRLAAVQIQSYLIPRLSTIQLTVCVLISRPADNAGQSDNLLSYAVGTAHTLGLHVDPKDWDIPEAERSLRRRLWWMLLIHDRFRALLFGRPTKIDSSHHNVPMPDTSDCTGERASLEAFDATCRLTLLVEEIIARFFSVRQLFKSSTMFERIVALEDQLRAVDELERDLPPSLRYEAVTRGIMSTLPTGIKSFQLSLLGVQAVLYRLLVDTVPSTDTLAIRELQQRALAVCCRAIDLISKLSKQDRELFWMPYTPHHISNVVSLLLRIAIRGTPSQSPGGMAESSSDPHVLATRETSRLMDILARIVREDQWDIALSAIQRSAFLLLRAARRIPGLRETYNLASTILGHSQTPNSASIDDLLISLGLNPSDMSAWGFDALSAGPGCVGDTGSGSGSGAGAAWTSGEVDGAGSVPAFDFFSGISSEQ